jgi:hypothetical protein
VSDGEAVPQAERRKPDGILSNPINLCGVE